MKLISVAILIHYIYGVHTAYYQVTILTGSYYTGKSCITLIGTFGETQELNLVDSTNANLVYRHSKWAYSKLYESDNIGDVTGVIIRLTNPAYRLTINQVNINIGNILTSQFNLHVNIQGGTAVFNSLDNTNLYKTINQKFGVTTKFSSNIHGIFSGWQSVQPLKSLHAPEVYHVTIYSGEYQYGDKSFITFIGINSYTQEYRMMDLHQNNVVFQPNAETVVKLSVYEDISNLTGIILRRVDNKNFWQISWVNVKWRETVLTFTLNTKLYSNITVAKSLQPNDVKLCVWSTWSEWGQCDGQHMANRSRDCLDYFGYYTKPCNSCDGNKTELSLFICSEKKCPELRKQLLKQMSRCNNSSLINDSVVHSIIGIFSASVVLNILILAFSAVLLRQLYGITQRTPTKVDDIHEK